MHERERRANKRFLKGIQGMTAHDIAVARLCALRGFVCAIAVVVTA